MSRENTSPPTGAVGFLWRPAPVRWRAVVRADALNLTFMRFRLCPPSQGECKPLDWDCQPWFYRRLEAYGFVGLCEGGLGSHRDLLGSSPEGSNGCRETHPRTQWPLARGRGP